MACIAAIKSQAGTDRQAAPQVRAQGDEEAAAAIRRLATGSSRRRSGYEPKMMMAWTSSTSRKAKTVDE